MAGPDDEDDIVPVVRPYLRTMGRTRPAKKDLDLVTQVRAVPTTMDASALAIEHRMILDLCQRPLSVAEVAAYINAPVVVAKVLLSDLIFSGHIVASKPAPATGGISLDLLQAVLDGVRRL